MTTSKPTGPTVLLVDDSAFARRCLAQCLRSAGLGRAEMLEAEHGQHALEVLDEHEVQLIVTDLVMPIMDGAEFVRRVREKGRHVHTPLVVVSSIAEAATKERLLASGANAVISKPVSGPKAMEILRVATGVSA